MSASISCPVGAQGQIGGCARFLRCPVNATANVRGKHKVLSEMGNVLEENYFVIERDVIEENQVLMQLPHIANVGHDRQAKLLCHQAHREKFAHAREPGAIGLDEMRPSVLEEVLE